jgi:hypothetical protein
MGRYSGTEAATNHAKCIVAYDVTERRLMDQRLRNTVNRLLALYDAGRILGSSLQQETIGATLVEIVRRIADSSAALIYLYKTVLSGCVCCALPILRILQATSEKRLLRKLRAVQRWTPATVGCLTHGTSGGAR